MPSWSAIRQAVDSLCRAHGRRLQLCSRLARQGKAQSRAYRQACRDAEYGDDEGVGDRSRVRIRAQKGVKKRSEEHTSELQSLMRISYAVFCLKKKKNEENLTP